MPHQRPTRRCVRDATAHASVPCLAFFFAYGYAARHVVLLSHSVPSFVYILTMTFSERRAGRQLVPPRLCIGINNSYSSTPTTVLQGCYPLRYDSRCISALLKRLRGLFVPALHSPAFAVTKLYRVGKQVLISTTSPFSALRQRRRSSHDDWPVVPVLI